MGEDEELVAELWRNSTVIVSVAQKTSRDIMERALFLTVTLYWCSDKDTPV